VAEAGSIGIFDSGVGGLSILREVRALMPDRSLVYLADHAYAPYGSKGLEQVRRRSVAIARFLRERGAGTIVVACNTASAAALHHLRDVYPDTPFVGMEPAVKPAARRSARRVIGVLATPATFQGELYASVLDRHAAGVTVVEAAPEGLAMAIDEGRIADAVEILRVPIGEMIEAGVDRIVLGCTHYAFVADVVAELAGPGVEVIDPSPAVARQVVRVAGSSAAVGPVEYLTTGDPDRFAVRVEGILGGHVVPEPVEV